MSEVRLEGQNRELDGTVFSRKDKAQVRRLKEAESQVEKPGLQVNASYAHAKNLSPSVGPNNAGTGALALRRSPGGKSNPVPPRSTQGSYLSQSRDFVLLLAQV